MGAIRMMRSRRVTVRGRAVFQGETKGAGTFFELEVGLAATANRPKNEPGPTPVNGYRTESIGAMRSEWYDAPYRQTRRGATCHTAPHAVPTSPPCQA